MKEENEVQVIDNKRNNGIRVKKEDRVITFSPEAVTQMTDLATQLISESTKVTVGYFREQSNMYCDQLKAFISQQSSLSEERKIMLHTIEKITDRYTDLVCKTDNAEKREVLIEACERVSKIPADLYTKNLTDSLEKEAPKSPSLLKGIKRFLSSLGKSMKK